MRRCYARASAAENPLRPEAPKSPWSRRIGFSAPSGHFRIVLFLIGFFVWFLGLLIDGRFFFVLCSASVSYGFVLRFSLGAYVFRLFFLILCGPMVPLVAFVFRRRFFHWGFMSFVRLQVSFIDPSVPFSWLCFSSSFPVLHSFFLFSSFSFAWLACSFPFRGFRLRSGRFVFVLRFRLSASPRRNAPSGGGVGPIGQGRPRARGRPPRGWRGGVGPGSRTRAAMGGWGRRRRGGRRPVGSAGRRTRRRR